MNNPIRPGLLGSDMAWKRPHRLELVRSTNKYETAAVCNKTDKKRLSDIEMGYAIPRTIKEDGVLSI